MTDYMAKYSRGYKGTIRKTPVYRRLSNDGRVLDKRDYKRITVYIINK